MKLIINIVIVLGVIIVIPGLILGFLFGLYKNAFISGIEYNDYFWKMIKEKKKRNNKYNYYEG